MAKYLLIAEKPSLMREIQQVYSKMSMTDTIDFASFAGHVIGMKEPREYDNELWQSKKWSWEMLPMIPEKFEYKVSYGKEQLYKEINKKLKATKYDYVINACDPDREAESIFWYFMEHAKCKLPVKRFWTNDLTEVSIKNALNNLRDSEEDFLRNLRTASRLRGQFDWLVGMNLTIASSLKLKSISKVGRVKTPTLKIIADRELEIKNFTPTTTYEVKGVFDASGVAYDGVFIEENTITKFKTKEDAMKILDALSKDCVVESIESKEESSQAPQLYSLSSLQTEASELYGFSAEQTKTSVQTLYEKKILSYPRTDNPYISSELAKEFGKMLSAVYEVKSLSKYKGTITKESMDKVSKNKRYVNDKKMAESGHYAIVPTGMKPNYSIMNKDEELIFEMVAKRFLAIFMPPLRTNKSTLITNNSIHLFRTTGKTLIDLGYTELYKTQSKDTLLPNLKKGDKVTFNEGKVVDKISTPPSRYTEGTLISAMKSPSKFLNDDSLKETIKDKKGIGTTATRDNIIVQLINDDYITKKKEKGKVEYIYATDKGLNIIENMKDIDVSSVDLTGIWEEKLSLVENGEINEMEFIEMMRGYVKESIDKIKNLSATISRNTSDMAVTVVGKCPKCSKKVTSGKNFYTCEDYKQGCDFILNPEILGKRLTDADMKKILKGERTKEYTFKKDDKTWTCGLILKDNQISFDFNKSKAVPEKLNVSCPSCGSSMKESAKSFYCEKYKNSCTFIISKETFGATITKKDLTSLIDGETITKKFTWKSGKSGNAGLKLDKNNKTEFVFNNK